MASLRARATVVLLFRVDGEGRITSVEVQGSSGIPALDEHARRWALERWRYPALGSPFRTLVPFHFDP
jgi:TonB family protein